MSERIKEKKDKARSLLLKGKDSFRSPSFFFHQWPLLKEKGKWPLAKKEKSIDRRNRMTVPTFLF